MQEHVVAAMLAAGFPVSQQEIDTFLDDLNKIKAVKSIQSTPREQLKLKKHGMSEDQLLEEQEKLIASAKDIAVVLRPEERLEDDKEEYD